MRIYRAACFFILPLLGFSLPAYSQPSLAAPGPTFETVHLVTATPAQEQALRTAVADFNLSFARLGCTSCAYRLFRMVQASGGRYTDLLRGEWPNPAEYARVHASPVYTSAADRNPVMGALARTEFYARLVEFAPSRPGKIASLSAR
jgi:hypothetical protein